MNHKPNYEAMTTKDLHQLCRQEKLEAMARYDQSHSQDEALAINAWDELLGQCYKHRNIRPEQFSKTKDTALRIVAMIGDKVYRETVTQKICQL